VIVEGYHPESELLMSGRHQGQCPEIDGMVIINDGRAVTAFGERYMVEITDVAGYDLVGAAIEKEV
jgi:ribosomal protein S12 methylthiotransferase